MYKSISVASMQNLVKIKHCVGPGP